HEDRTIVRSGPEDIRIETRRAHRVERRVDLLASHVARDRFSGGDLSFGTVRGDVGAEARPMNAAVDRLVHVLRAVVHDFRVVRVALDRGLPNESIAHVLRILPVALLRIDPVVLLLPGLDVVAAELTLAVAVDDFSVRRDANLPALAA